jgi:hypothetical protein
MNVMQAPQELPAPAIEDWALELGCTVDDLLSALGESGRLHFERSPSEQYELDLGAAA